MFRQITLPEFPVKAATPNTEMQPSKAIKLLGGTDSVLTFYMNAVLQKKGGIDGYSFAMLVLGMDSKFTGSVFYHVNFNGYVTFK